MTCQKERFPYGKYVFFSVCWWHMSEALPFSVETPSRSMGGDGIWQRRFSLPPVIVPQLILGTPYSPIGKCSLPGCIQPRHE